VHELWIKFIKKLSTGLFFIYPQAAQAGFFEFKFKKMDY